MSDYKKLFFLLGGVVLAWIAFGVLLFNYSERGSFGDMFGSLNTLFSGFAFAALIFTIWMQKDDLSLQRQELQLTRSELSGQREQMAAQAATLKLQQFERTFFSLLQLHAEIVSSIDFVSPEHGTTRGRDCIKILYNRLTNSWTETDSDNSLDEINQNYLRFYTKHESEIGHYFRNLYHIIKFIKTSGIENPKQYTNFVRAQLSSHELALLFYNCLAITGINKFKPLVEEFSLLKNMPQYLVMDTMHLHLYESNAYAGSAPSL